MKPISDEERRSYCQECYTCQQCVNYQGYEGRGLKTPADIEAFVKMCGKKEPLWRRSLRLCWHILTLRWLKIATRKSVDSKNSS